jgi:hypothetical protein
MTAQPHELAPWLTSGVAVALVVGAVFWKADDLISSEGRAKISAAMSGLVDADPDATRSHIQQFLSEFLPPPPRTAIYARNVAIISLAALVAVGAVYFSRVGGFWLQFTVGADNAWNFIFQLVGDGFLKVFLVNYIALLPHRFYVAQLPRAGLVTCFGLLALDVLFRLVLFFIVSAAIWYLFVQFGGSFGGDYGAALRSLPETFAYAARFADLTGVYLYASALSSLPLFLAVFLRMSTAAPWLSKTIATVFFWLPLRDKPIRLASIGLATCLSVFAMISSTYLTLISAAEPPAAVHPRS